jgi:hypothetical protein
MATITDDAYQAQLNASINKVDSDVLKSGWDTNNSILKNRYDLGRDVGNVNTTVLKSASDINDNIKSSAYKLNGDIIGVDRDVLKSACDINDNVKSTGYKLNSDIMGVDRDVLQSACKLNENINRVDADLLKTSCLQSAELMDEKNRKRFDLQQLYRRDILVFVFEIFHE